jgi:hypothetical protein
VIRDNLVHDIDRWTYRSPTGVISLGTLMGIDGAPRNLHVENNTMLANGNILAMSGQPMAGFRFTDNIAQKIVMPHPDDPSRIIETYGLFGTGSGEGNAALARYAPDAVVTGNVLAGCRASDYSSYPGNNFPTVATLNAAYADAPAGNFRQTVYLAKGCDQDAIETAQQPPPCTFTVSPLAVELPADGTGWADFAVTCTSVGLCTGRDFDVLDVPAWLAWTTGPTSVYLDADPNLATEPRLGTITIAGQVVTITQAAAAPPPTLEERIVLLAGLALIGCANVGGNVSPQTAAREAVELFRDAILEALAE